MAAMNCMSWSNTESPPKIGANALGDIDPDEKDATKLLISWICIEFNDGICAFNVLINNGDGGDATRLLKDSTSKVDDDRLNFVPIRLTNCSGNCVCNVLRMHNQINKCNGRNIFLKNQTKLTLQKIKIFPLFSIILYAFFENKVKINRLRTELILHKSHSNTPFYIISFSWNTWNNKICLMLTCSNYCLSLDIVGTHSQIAFIFAQIYCHLFDWLAILLLI